MQAPRVSGGWLGERGYWLCCGEYRLPGEAACRHCGQARPEQGPAARGATAAPAAKRGPNVTEQRYYQDRLAAGPPAAYEAITLHLAGHRYTPDWVVQLPDGRLECHEVKGSHKLGSYQRSRLAFDLAAATYPRWVWVWAEWTGSEWRVTVRDEGRAGA